MTVLARLSLEGLEGLEGRPTKFEPKVEALPIIRGTAGRLCHAFVFLEFWRRTSCYARVGHYGLWYIGIKKIGQNSKKMAIL